MKALIRANLKYHGRRYAATIVAVVIAVAFVGAALVLGGSLNRGVRDQVAGQYQGVAAVVSGENLREEMPTIDALPEVTETYPATYSGIEEDGQWLAVALAGEGSLGGVPLVEGDLPTGANQAVIGEAAADRLGVEIGSTVGDFQIVGLASDAQHSVTLLVEDFYVTEAGLAAIDPEWQPHEILVASDSPNIVAEIQNALPNAEVISGTEALNNALAAVNTSDAALTAMVLLFPVIAGTVALIVVGTTFQVIFRQRERELALLRVVGATAKQVRRLMMGESLAVGAIGSLVGIVIGVFGGAAIAAGLGVVSSYGLALSSVRPIQMLVLFVLGTLLTAFAGYRPALRASRVSPITALGGPKAPPVGKRRVVAATISGVVTLAFGVEAAYLALLGGDMDDKMGRFGAVLLFAVLTVVMMIVFLSYALPMITKASGKFSKSETFTIAAANTARNPGRTAATGVAIFIGVALISMVTLGAQSLRATAMEGLDSTAPVDLVVSSPDFTDQQLTALQNIPGASESVVVEGAPATVGGDLEGTLLVDDGLDRVTRGGLVAPKPGVALVPAWWAEELGTAPVCVADNCVDLELVDGGAVAAYGRIIVSPETAAQLDVQPTQVWLQLENPASYSDALRDVESINPEFGIEGAVAIRAAINQVVNVLVMVVVGLLGVSVLVALVGMTNTLSLSVAERTRENGLLRALGMTRKQVRGMLTWEALLISVASTVLGIAAGGYFGLIGFRSLPIGVSTYVVQVPWLQWVVIFAVAVGAALLASIVPGRTASRVSPVEALAAE